MKSEIRGQEGPCCLSKKVAVREADGRARSDLHVVPGRFWAGDQSYGAPDPIPRLYGRPAVLPLTSQQILENNLFFQVEKPPLLYECCFHTLHNSSGCFCIRQSNSRNRSRPHRPEKVSKTPVCPSCSGWGHNVNSNVNKVATQP